MSKAITAYKKITASPDYQELERMREKARMDEADKLSAAEKRGIEKGREEGREEGREALRETARRLKSEGAEITLIAKVTGLTEEEVATL